MCRAARDAHMIREISSTLKRALPGNEGEAGAFPDRTTYESNNKSQEHLAPYTEVPPRLAID
jgi:hypothetical protein